MKRRPRAELGSYRSAALLAVLLFVIGNAQADEDFFRVSPGPLSLAHAAYDASQRCGNCHVSSEGVSDKKCLDCHQAVHSRGRLHATFSGKPCISCHTEHKGRQYSIIDWGTVGGRKSFDHERTGFELSAHHGDVACTKCHVAKLKSGRTSHLGLSRDCNGCHSGVHGFTRRELARDCERCHRPGRALRGQKLSAWSREHDALVHVPLLGRHRDQLCTRCHTGGVMSGSSPRKCQDCHAPTHPVTKATAVCVGCHSQSAPMKSATVDHSGFGFPLEGRHAKASCKACHQRGEGAKRVEVAEAGRVRGCSSCHVASHPMTRATYDCARCHPSGGTFRGAKVDHARFGFGLFGEHQGLRCFRCHTKRQRKLDYSEGECVECHTHRGAHGGQFSDKPCASCHVEGGKRSEPFDHDVDSRFPLIGFHGQEKVRNDCELCHPDGIYRVGTVACKDCHEDFHRGQLGSDCTQCHSPTVHFSSPRTENLDHSIFPLLGKHRTTQCRACHVDNNYNLASHECIACHADDDAHAGRLGQDCGRCHLPTKGAPKFDHELMTSFPLTGAHARAECWHCHRPGTEPARPLSVEEWRQVSPAAVDRRFPVRGRACRDCHADPHQGYVGQDCDTCHTTTHFSVLTGPQARAILPASHRGGWLQRHAMLPLTASGLSAERQNCETCHGTPVCRGCHLSERPRSHSGLWRLRTHGTAAEFDPSACAVCHEAAACTQCHERTAPLNHRGNWLGLHGYASGGFGESNCYVCHRRTECLQCHRSP